VLSSALAIQKDGASHNRLQHAIIERSSSNLHTFATTKMHANTSTSSGSTPVGPLILFLFLCLLFQLPTFTKASESLVTAKAIPDEIISPPADLINTIPNQDQHIISTHNNTLPLNRAILPRAASPQWTTPIQPQVIIQTLYTTVQPPTTPSYQYYASATSTTTATVTDSSNPNRVATTTTTVRGFITQNNYQNQQYCSTLYANGGGLPTTRAGNCGTILVEEPPAANAANEVAAVGKRSRLALLAVVVGAFVVGAVG
jgi:hypothetical protein